MQASILSVFLITNCVSAAVLPDEQTSLNSGSRSAGQGQNNKHISVDGLVDTAVELLERREAERRGNQKDNIPGSYIIENMDISLLN